MMAEVTEFLSLSGLRWSELRAGGRRQQDYLFPSKTGLQMRGNVFRR
jgi:hypothetical protein